MNDHDLAQARSAVASILSALDVSRVVYVDDYNTTAPTVEDTIAAALTLNPAIIQQLFPELGNPPPNDPDVLRQKILEVWITLDSKLQVERGKDVIVAARRSDGDETDDAADIAVLEQIVPSDSLVSLSPADWERQREKLLQESKVTRTLFIFDRDLSHAGGDSEGGIKIIASLLAKADTGGLICGLLTHTVTPETQAEQWEFLSTAHSIQRDRFVVIPKRHLSQSPMLFAQTLKFAALSPDFAELKQKTKAIICEAVAAAADRVEKVSIYDLDHIVFQVSAGEGIWEPDMLFRLHAMFHRLESRRLAHEGGALEEIAAKLRAVSKIPAKGELWPTPDSAWALQREELYEFDHINKNCLPLELGDIFERVGSSSAKKYILLAQPCDLMVRSDGKRYPEIYRFPLAEVVPGDSIPHYSEELPYFDISPSKKWFVKLKVVHFVRGCILDLCTFNHDGVAKLELKKDAPSGIRPGLKNRYQILSREIDRIVRKAAVLSPSSGDKGDVSQFKKKMRADLGGMLFDDDLFKINFPAIEDTGSIEFYCKRIARLSPARAIGMLMTYTATLGRPAYDAAFGMASES